MGAFPRHPSSLLCKGLGARTRSQGRAGDHSATSPKNILRSKMFGRSFLL